MPTRVDTHPTFRKRTRRLRRRFPSIHLDLRPIIQRLRNDERPGQLVPRVGYTVYKVRLPNRAARRGKSGGFRVIYYVQFSDRVTLLTIYSKTDETDLSIAEIRQLALEADE
ncbi:MAG: type II toxin-antitoxin system RelE/ParE family toxin [Chloroflexota bacterium]|nr:type II toxin-antitoxin system RelE/ParE family toxin [Chloroflexota bacterium]MDE2855880.1 type II toxin-antitoxin system RelE/ParE family toxin [Chloroflexota bacterium]MDE2945521.1 type II toxin-antitoxin system RelE/ParE family toxin [Chloroflexota bacterium]